MKKLISAAATAALVAAMGLPAMAASPTVTIQWNVAKTATMNLYENYNNAGATSTTMQIGGVSSGYGGLFTGNNGGSGNCGGTGSSITESTTAGILNIGQVTPDAVKETDCVFLNGAEAVVNSNDSTGVTLTEAIAAPATAGTVVCGDLVTGGKGAAWMSAKVAGSTLTAANAYDSNASDATNATGWTGSTCAALTSGGTGTAAGAFQGTSTTGVSGSNTALAATTFAQTSDSASGANMYIGEDFAVLFPPYATYTASDSSVITYTLTAN